MCCSTSCLRKLGVENVELLINLAQRMIALRPCGKEDPNAIRWGRMDPPVPAKVSCRGLLKLLSDSLGWTKESTYKLFGHFIRCGTEKVLLFSLDEAVITNIVSQVIVSETGSEEIILTEQIKMHSESFGKQIESISATEVYDGALYVLCPAREVEHMNPLTHSQLDSLKNEVATIMKGWESPNG